MARLIVHNTIRTVGGGHMMLVLHWLEGLRRLGHEVLYYDRGEERADAALFAQTMERWWDRDHSAAMLPSGFASLSSDRS